MLESEQWLSDIESIFSSYQILAWVSIANINRRFVSFYLASSGNIWNDAFSRTIKGKASLSYRRYSHEHLFAPYIFLVGKLLATIYRRLLDLNRSGVKISSQTPFICSQSRGKWWVRSAERWTAAGARLVGRINAYGSATSCCTKGWVKDSLAQAKPSSWLAWRSMERERNLT